MHILILCAGHMLMNELAIKDLKPREQCAYELDTELMMNSVYSSHTGQPGQRHGLVVNFSLPTSSSALYRVGADSQHPGSP